MKKILFAVAAVALLFATSCKKENINPAIDVPEGSFLATIDNGANPQNAPRINDGMSTMTTIDANRYVIWENGDQIKINGETYTTNTSGSSVVFSGGNATGTTFHAFYPASIAGTDAAGVLPATQTIVAGKVSNLPMYAYSTDNQLTFHNICAALKITVPAACDSIVVSADENMRGEFTLDASTYTAQLAATGDNLGKSVKMVKSEGKFAAAEIAYVAIPAGTYTNFTIKFYNGESIDKQKTVESLAVDVNKAYNVKFPMELCFTAQEATTIGMTAVGSSAPDVSLEFSVYDASAKTNGNWGPFAIGSTSVALDLGDKVYFRAGTSTGNNTISKDSGTDDYYCFTSTGNVTVSGNIMYLLSQTPATTLTSGQYFCSLFKDMINLTDASELILPATTLSQKCYLSMFEGCIALTKAPALPATKLANSCYSAMFKDCSTLVKAPALKATSLSNYCYQYMFQNCTNLTTVPEFAATALNQYCCGHMFSGCTNLTSVPELKATTLAQGCYSSMFADCSKLTSVTMKATNVSSKYCLDSWLKNAGTDQSVTSRTVNIDPSITTLSSGEGATIKSKTSSRWMIKNNNTNNPVNEAGSGKD